MKPEGNGAGAAVVSDLAKSLSEALLGTAEPVKEEVAKIDEEIQSREQSRKELLEEIHELKQVRQKAMRMLAIADPSLRLKGRRKTAATNTHRAEREALKSKEKREAVLTYLQAHAAELNESGFVASSLHNANGLTGIGKSLLQKIVEQLADEGVVRLDRIGRAGGKIYKVVSDGQT
jgi:Mg2+ and Co2+ transporter CorA